MAKGILTFKLTQEHIDRAMTARLQHDRISLSCPIAQALQDRYPGAWVGLGTAFIPELGQYITLDEKASNITKGHVTTWPTLQPGTFTAAL